MKNNTIKVLMLEPGNPARVAEIEASQEALEKTVQGAIQAIYPFEDPVCIICNDSGKTDHLPLCRILFGANHEIQDIICGPAFICGFDDEKFVSLNAAQIEKYMSKFLQPEWLLSWDLECRKYHKS